MECEARRKATSDSSLGSTLARPTRGSSFAIISAGRLRTRDEQCHLANLLEVQQPQDRMFSTSRAANHAISLMTYGVGSGLRLVTRNLLMRGEEA
jgi:hypothetical protein